MRPKETPFQSELTGLLSSHAHCLLMDIFIEKKAGLASIDATSPSQFKHFDEGLTQSWLELVKQGSVPCSWTLQQVFNGHVSRYTTI